MRLPENLDNKRWHGDAKCEFKGLLSTDDDEIAEVKSKCNGCSVVIHCYVDFSEIEFSGIYAGLDEYERKMLSWRRVNSGDEDNFGNSYNVVRTVLRRDEQIVYSRRVEGQQDS